MVKRICLLVLALLAILPSTIALAIANPDSPPSLNGVFIYELSDGGLGVIVDYELDYASLPDENASDSFLSIFINTDNTQVKAVAPYSYHTRGYGRGVIWIPFSASEVSTYNLAEASVSSYAVWMMGNPTLNWTGNASQRKTIYPTIDLWQPYISGWSSTLIAQRILSLAQTLETSWGGSWNLIEATANGNKLTAVGEDYFINVIPDLRTIAPSVLSSGITSQTPVGLAYSRTFGAVANNGTGALAGAPLTLSEGTTAITITQAGTFTITLNSGVTGNITNGTGIVTGSPVDLVAGINTLTVPLGGTGTLVIEVKLVTFQTQINDTITGTALDTTSSATQWGLSRGVFSGFIWFAITIIICGVIYKQDWDRARRGLSSSIGLKGVIIAFDLCIIAGGILGLLPMTVVYLLSMSFGIITCWLLWGKSGSEPHYISFFLMSWLVVCLVGSIAAGENVMSATYLTSALDGDDTTINVQSTGYFPDVGVIQIDNERIAYAKKTSTTFQSAFTSPLVRGAYGTDNSSHASGQIVRTTEGGMLNSAVAYNIASMTDSSGVWEAITVGAPSLIRILGSFFVPPFDFLGTDLWIITIFWIVLGAGMLISIGLRWTGARRVG